MKQNLFALILVTSLAILHATELPEGFRMSRSGIFSFESVKFQILSHDSGWSPQNNNSWKNVRVEDSAKGKRLTARTDIGSAAVSIVSDFHVLSPKEISSNWTFAFSREVTLNSLSGSLMIPSTIQQLEINGKPYMLPEKFDPKRYQVHIRKLHSLKLEYAPGRFVTIRTKSPVPVMIQDNRKFNANKFDIRVSFSQGSGKMKKSALSLAFQLESASSVPVELSHAMNRTFPDVPGGTPKSGELSYEGLKFNLQDPNISNGNDIIALAGAKRQADCPEKVTVPLSGRSDTRALNLLHMAEQAPSPQKELGTITVKYKNAPDQKITVISGRDVGEFQSPGSVKNGEVIWIAETANSAAGLYASSFPLKNTNPVSATFEVTAPETLWMISAASLSDHPASFSTVAMKNIVRKIDREWLPLDFRNKVVPGSPLDFSFLKNDAPAGKYGHVVKASDGTLTFEKAPGKRLKLFGVNLCFSANYPAKETADALAENLVRAGYNSVRFHHADDLMLNRKSPDSTTLDPVNMDRLDYLFHALKKRGFYITIDFYSSRMIRKGDRIPGMERGAGNTFKALIPISPELMENWKKYVRAWMTHRNPYTGMTWAEDPALWCVNLVNEDLLSGYWSKSPAAVKLYQKTFESWKTEHRAPNAKMHNDDMKFTQFLYEIQAKSLAEQRRFAKEELGMKAMFTSLNHNTKPLQTILRGTFDLVDNHTYHDHPSYPERAWSLPSAFSQNSAIENSARVPAALMPSRVFGLPFIITEYNYCYPNRFRSESGPLMGCYAALQDWDAIYRFAWAHDAKKINQPIQMEGFDISGDPLSQLSDRITAAMFLRGDVRQATRKYAYSITASIFNEPVCNNAYPYKFAKLGLISQIGSTLNATEEQRKQLRLFNNAGEIRPSFLNSKKDADRWEKAIGGEPAVSSTGEIRLESSRQTLLVTAPRTESITTARPSAAGKFLKLEKGRCFQTVAAISLDKKPLTESRNILILHLTNVNNANSVFGNRQMTLLRNNGTLPYLVQRGTADITLNTPHEYQITALTADGAPLGTVHGKRFNGFHFKVDTGCFKGGVMAYHLTR